MATNDDPTGKEPGSFGAGKPALDILEIPADITGGAKDVEDYWQSVRGDKFAPAWARDFSLEELRPATVSNLSVVDVIDGGVSYRYRFWGTNHTNIKGYEMSGKTVDDCPTDVIAQMGYEQYKGILAARAPRMFIYTVEYPDRVFKGNAAFRFPLSDDGESITQIATYQDLDVRQSDWEAFFDKFAEGKSRFRTSRF